MECIRATILAHVYLLSMGGGGDILNGGEGLGSYAEPTGKTPSQG
jgi:hypothetical protein